MEDREALYWSNTENGVRCELCPHRCLINTHATGVCGEHATGVCGEHATGVCGEHAAGVCGVRENRGGTLVASGYGRISSIALDPIEKKPLYMFHPGKNILSVGGFGCNLRCPFCQNHEISMAYADRRDKSRRGTEVGARHITPEDFVRLALQTVPEGNIGAAYTYNEPLIAYEFLYDCAGLIRAAGLKNVVVTNGYINKEPMENLLPLIDAMNIDLKGFSDGFYNKVGGTLEPVKETIALAMKQCHVEITTLIIPGENEDDIVEISSWLASIDPAVPLHLSRFFPRYMYGDRSPTPRDTVLRLRDTARKYLNNVFTGNMG